MTSLLSILFPLGQLVATLIPQLRRLLYSHHFDFYKKVDEDEIREAVGSAIYHESLPRLGEAKTLKSDILDLLQQDRPAPTLLVGKAGIGKTQLALDLCYELGWRVLRPKSNELEDLSTSAWFRYGKKAGTVLLLDDLNTFLSRIGEGSSLDRIIERTSSEYGIVLATCRSNAYDQLVAAKLDSRHFHEVRIPDWSETEGTLLAKSLGTDFDPRNFDGTPICLTMGFGPQQEVYGQLDRDSRTVLHGAKLLYLGGLMSKARQPSCELLRRVCEEILSVDDFGRALQQVGSTELLTQSPGDRVFCYEAVMERVVSDFPSTESASWQLLEKVGELLASMRDSESLFLIAITAYLAGQENIAIGLNSLVIEIDPQLAAAYSNRGVARGKLEDYQGAIDDYTKAIEIDPQYAAAYCNRGIARSELEDYLGAIDDYTKAIEIDPQDAPAYYNRGITRSELEDYQRAIDDYTKAIEIDPQDAPAYYNRGVVRGELEDYQGAIEDYTKAIEIDPQKAKAYYNRGVARGKLEDYQSEIDDYTKAIEIDPQLAAAYCNRGVARGELEDRQGEIEDYTKAIEIDPQHAAAYYNRGIGRGKLEDYQGEIDDYTKAIEIDPQFAKAYHNRGVARGELEDYQGAIEDYTKAIEIDPQFAKAYYDRGVARGKLGDRQGAIEEYAKAFKIDPSLADNHGNS